MRALRIGEQFEGCAVADVVGRVDRAVDLHAQHAVGGSTSDGHVREGTAVTRAVRKRIVNAAPVVAC
jgi:hypothetical protein